MAKTMQSLCTGGESRRLSLGQWAGLLPSAFVTTLILAWVLWYCSYGIDFTDESFYLVWMANPFNYGESVTQFGFVYHLLYELLHGDIVALRRVNILITFGLAWVLCAVFLKTVFDAGSFQGPSGHV